MGQIYYGGYNEELRITTRQRWSGSPFKEKKPIYHLMKTSWSSH